MTARISVRVRSVMTGWEDSDEDRGGGREPQGGVANAPGGRRRRPAAAGHAGRGTGPPRVDLADHASELFDVDSPTIEVLLESVAKSDVVVVASPTYKATYTGLLKAFLDRYPNDALARDGLHPCHDRCGTDPRPRARGPLAAAPGRARRLDPHAGVFVTEQQFDELDAVIEAWAADRPAQSGRRARARDLGQIQLGAGPASSASGGLLRSSSFSISDAAAGREKMNPWPWSHCSTRSPSNCVLLLDALCQCDQSERPSELDERMDEGRGIGRPAHLCDERPIDLQDIDGELAQIGQRGVPRAEIVDGNHDAQLLQPIESRNGRLRILHQDRFGDLE